MLFKTIDCFVVSLLAMTIKSNIALSLRIPIYRDEAISIIYRNLNKN